MGESFLEELQSFVSDPISYELMEDAVVTPYGHSFNQLSINTWLMDQSVCPVSRQQLTQDMLRPNYAVRDLVKFLKTSSSKLTDLEKALGSGEADRIKKRRKQIDMDLRVSQAMKGHYEKELDGVKREKDITENEISKLESEIETIASKLETKKEMELLNLTHDFEATLLRLEKNEDQLTVDIICRKRDNAELDVKVRGAVASPFPSFISNEKALAEQLKKGEEKLEELSKSVASIASQKSDTADALLRAKEMLSELQVSQRGSKLILDTLEEKLGKFKSSRATLESNENRFQSRVKALSDQIEELEKELQKAIRDLNLCVERMKKFLSGVEQIEEEIDGDFSRVFAATKLKEEGNEMFRTQHFREAADLYSQALEIFIDPAFLLNRAAAFTQLAEYGKARNDLSVALDLEMSPEW
eukprot:CAMPEP_0201476236 /NCGR_PEP_ID=MMETSP0151_2-20130828/1482_1 /ASSEMBLY_ACC=CAM_ASM_000257 /TAXON_ID=200890 /ORGANISM="Paramoeba atlantica, Strain 621/1 / CCAP 1560/9" /LENGTH=415 /DNA_ID=CAMNT_0047856543 /DNA_START=58 /DNA_END=1302 /DNA_ORIENTATION=-